MEKRRISFRIDEADFQKLRGSAESKGISLSDIIRMKLKEGFNNEKS
jgi:antitoxin component of RelBE/YafQ-DinJ toxin-antitoxin module